VVIYADDVTLLHHVSECEPDKSHEEIEHIAQWARDNKMIINTDKTYAMALSTNISSVVFTDAVLNDSIAAEVESLKILGFTFENNLSKDAHFTTIVKKA